jgi:REP element-mobilizing transposase RayT
MNEYWLITTNHLENRLLFKDAEDFRVGMNYVAVQVHKKQVAVLVFILMSNHLHIILYCTREEAERFMNDWKTEYSRYLRNKYGSREHLRRNGVDIRPVPLENEGLERAMAYVQMNCVAANICGSPGGYPWGTGDCFFKVPIDGIPSTAGKLDSAKGTAESGSKPLAGISDRKRYRLFHSKADLPNEWLMAESGYILPSSYVCKDLVERVFRTPRRMNYFLQSSSKAKQRLETGEQSLPAFKDQVIVSALPDLCWSLFRKQQVSELSPEQLLELMRQLRFRFAANVNQIARVTGLTYEEAAAYLDRV